MRHSASNNVQCPIQPVEVIGYLRNAVNYGEEIAIEQAFWSVYSQRKASELLFVYYLQAIQILRRKHSSFCILPFIYSLQAGKVGT
jgi:hypothetical protein